MKNNDANAEMSLLQHLKDIFKKVSVANRVMFKIWNMFDAV